MTPNTLMWPQPQTCKIKNLYLFLGFNLSYPKLWLIYCVTRYLKTSLNRKLPIIPEVGRIVKNCVVMSDCFDTRNLSAKFQRKRFVRSTELENFAAEIGAYKVLKIWVFWGFLKCLLTPGDVIWSQNAFENIIFVISVPRSSICAFQKGSSICLKKRVGGA